MKRPRAILHIDMDTFFCSVERLLEPSLEGRPVIVGGDPSSRGVVAACSYEARRFGVHSAMPLSRAGRLCPQAVYLPGNFGAYLHFSRLLRGLFDEYTPLVEPAGIDEAYLDLTGCRLALGEPAEVAGALRARIKDELGLPSSAGLSTSKVVSKVASKVAKPDGFVEVPAGGEVGFLSPLPVEKLPGVGPVCHGMLREMGIGTVGELSLLPVEALESVLGSWGRVLHENARGVDRRRVEAGGAPKSVSRETTYETDTIDYDMVRRTLLLLSERCCRALRSERLATSRIAVKLRHSDFNTYMKFRSIPVPTDQEQVVHRVALDLFERLLDRGVRIRLVGVALSGLVPAGCQGELFSGEGGSSLDFDSLNESVDLIRERFGFDAISRGSTLGLKAAPGGGIMSRGQGPAPSPGVTVPAVVRPPGRGC